MGTRKLQPDRNGRRILLMSAAGLLLIAAHSAAQTNPTPLSLPVSQNWGTTGFSSVPAGLAVWNGISGGATTTQAAAETSTPTGDAGITPSAPISGGAGGCYGYAVANDARLAINTSSNPTNGTNQLALAINTAGQSGITLNYDLINVINNTRTVGVVCQYRVGTSGEWTTLAGTGNPYVQSGGTVGGTTQVSLPLPAAAENEPVVQIRWAVWRGTEGGTSSAFAVDNITVTNTISGPIAPVAYAGPDRTITLNGGPLTELMVDATVQDANGLSGVVYAWSPTNGPGIVGWSGATGNVDDPTTPSNAAVTLNATGTYIFTLSAVDPTLLTDNDSVSITVVSSPPSGDYDPPPTYYNPARPGGTWYTGAALKTALNGIISDHISRSYDAAKQALQILDQDSANPANILLFYNGASVAKTWDNGNTWNREHIWPDSLNGSGAVDSDLFNLRSCDPDLNNDRGSLPFGIGAGYWDPNHGTNDRGNAARSLFYTATRYTNLTLVNGSPGNNQMGDLAKLIEWHYQDPVSTFERRRNHYLYSSAANPAYYQGNRNPFVDHPELVWTIWGNTSNDSMLYVGNTQPGNGASSLTIDLRVMLNQAAPSEAVTLRKVGSTPTTYNVTVTGQAASLSGGTGQTFIGGTQSRMIDATITATASVGLKTGSIIIDNTDLTSTGTGRGSADGNDVVNVSADVVTNRTIAATAVSFGTVYAGRPITRTATCSTIGDDHTRTRIMLNAGTYGSGEVKVIVASGNLFDADAETYPATIKATFSTPGTKNGTVTLNTANGALSGEGLTGESVQPIGVTYSANVQVCPQPSVDADDDNDVDQSDFGVFQQCVTGAGDPEGLYDTLPTICQCMDVTGPGSTPDGFIDEADLAAFLACHALSGADIPVNPACAP